MSNVVPVVAAIYDNDLPYVLLTPVDTAATAAVQTSRGARG